ncbi:MAG: hypothetical protein EAZ51_05015 [Sphingobacteriales bacterium]|nr:MAG: hypothetical protein EAZ64_07665 [Sphingobacteriales bacterium]TAF80963.1 MAG: hypothetical protein EAZ51_05015 [Sphingobacteriales bacterium]
MHVKTYIISLFFLIFAYAKAQTILPNISIYNFKIEENNPKQVWVQAIDTTKQKNTSINGTFTFYINGFTKVLEFKNGIAICELKLKKSSFVYFKHENETSNPSNLYFVYKYDNRLNPFKISWYILMAIPIGLILMGYMFKKIIGYAIFLLVAFFYFNYSGGLTVGTFLQSVFDGLRNIF